MQPAGASTSASTGRATSTSTRWRAAVSGPGVALACLQVANHEVGTRQPVDEAAAACAAAGVPLVLDVSSALGRVDLSHLPPGAVLIGGRAGLRRLPVRRDPGAAAAASAGGPPTRPTTTRTAAGPGPPTSPPCTPPPPRWRSGCARAAPSATGSSGLVDRLRAGILAGVPDVEVAGDPVDRVPHLLTFSALYVDGETLTLELDRAGFAVASGSACSASSEHPSHVLAAMGLLTHGNVRIGLTRRSTAAEVEAFLAVLPGIVARIRARARARPGSAAVSEPGRGARLPGQRCPLPVIALARRLPDVPLGAVLRLLADDPAAAPDVAAWCRMRGQTLVSSAPPAFEVRRDR